MQTYSTLLKIPNCSAKNAVYRTTFLALLKCAFYFSGIISPLLHKNFAALEQIFISCSALLTVHMNLEQTHITFPKPSLSPKKCLAFRLETQPLPYAPRN
jgi:hypothetical protein